MKANGIEMSTKHYCKIEYISTYKVSGIKQKQVNRKTCVYLFDDRSTKTEVNKANQIFIFF